MKSHVINIRGHADLDDRADITKKDEVKHLADEIASKESKGIHLLVNNGVCAWWP